MTERDLWWKIVIVGALCALALVSVYPLNQKIKFGIDLYGGYSLLYEIDDTGLDSAEKAGLSERVMHVLRERIDPKGVYNLVWRPVGLNRLEIQMPRPSAVVQEARATYERDQQKIQQAVLRQSTLLRALARPVEEQPAALAALVHGIEDRKPLLEAAATAYDAYAKMKAEREARVKQAEADNLSQDQVNRAVRLAPAERPAALDKLAGAFPQRRPLLEDAAKAWDEYQTALSANPASQAAQAPGADTQPTTQPGEHGRLVDSKKRAFDQTVQKVLDVNVDPDKLAEGPTIDKVLELEDTLNETVAKILGTNPEIGRLQLILNAKPGSPARNEELKKLTTDFPGLADTINSLVQAGDELQQRRRGEGRLEDPADLQRLLKGAGVLEFRILADPQEMRSDPGKLESYTEGLKNRGPRRLPGEENLQWFEIEDPKDFFKLSEEDLNLRFEANKKNMAVVAERHGDKYYVLSHIPEGYVLTHRPGEADWSLQSAHFDRDRTGRPAIGFTLDERGGSKFAVLTREHKGQQLAIFIDDLCVSHATIQDVIRTRGIIHGSFTPQEVNDMVKKLNAGSLPKKLKDPPISVRSIGPSLGEANREAGLKAATYGAIAVTVFMIIYYFYAGVIAVIAMFMNVLFIGAMMSVLGATLTLPGIAGLALAVGMAVDANVLIDERIREELNRGTAMRMAVKLGYQRAFSAILDSNLTTVLTSVILYFLGSEEVKGFGLTLGVGVFINMFTAYFVTRMFFDLMCMFPVPREVFQYPLYSAAIIAVGGGVLYAGGYFWNEPAMREQSILMFFGRAIAWIAAGVVLLLLLMYASRRVHGEFQKGAKPRIPMLRLIGVPKVDWIKPRYAFFTFSGILTIGALTLFLTIDKNDIFDIEFLGGTAAQIDLKNPGSLTQADITERLNRSSKTMLSYNLALANNAAAEGGGGTFTIETPGVPAARLEPVIKAVLDKKLSQIDPVRYEDPAAEAVTIHLKSDVNVDLAGMRRVVLEFGQRFLQAAEAIGAAQVQAVQAVGAGAEAGKSFEIVTRETNKELVVGALMETLHNDIDVQPALSFKLMSNARSGDVPYFPIATENPKDLGVGLTDAEAKTVDLQGWRGGVAMILDDVDPPQSMDVLRQRLRAMRLQPGFEKYGWRECEVFGLHSTTEGGGLFDRLMVVVADENYPLEDEKGGLSSAWVSDLAEPEVELLQAALQRQTSLSQITQFDKQVSRDAQLNAYIALVLSWLMIIIYVWFRFGKARWGLAAVIALVHDLIITTGCVVATYYLADTAIGKALLIDKFRIDLGMLAALLTIVGYSVNDTIIVFDRIRENRGRMTEVTPQMISLSINQTLSRTILTVLTVQMTVIIMYIFGGQGIHGFNYVMLIGLSFGTYSSVAIASQFLLRHRQLARTEA
jgi:protein-export membrane protein SecD/preprotein translocase SecF subunit